MPVALELSVVIPTHDRRLRLLRLLEALGEGSLGADRFEVIVVADGCTDDTVAVLGRMTFPFAVRVLEQTPGRGAATARNAGAAIARAPAIVFVDDDIEPFPSMLAVHATAQAEAREGNGDPLVMVGAPVPVRPSNASFHELAVWGWWEQQLERMAEPGHRFTYAEVFTGILSMPTALFAEVGGFETSLPYSCRDDSELGMRLIRRGARIAFSREGGGRHHELRSRASLHERKRAEGSADALIARLHPELWRVLPLARPGSDRRLRGFPRLAFHARWLGAPVTWAACRLLDVFERLRLRGFWRRLNAVLVYYQYWRGVASFLGVRSALVTLRDAARTMEETKPSRELAIDLCLGVPAAADAIDAARPDSLRVIVSGREVGRIPPQPGAELLRGRHLVPLLVRHLGERIVTAWALDDLLSRPPTEDRWRQEEESCRPVVVRREHGGSTRWRNDREMRHPVLLPRPIRLTTLDLDRPLMPIRGCAGAGAVRVLVRDRRVPIAWLTIVRPPATIEVDEIERFLLHRAGDGLRAASVLRETESNHERALPPISVVVCTRDRTSSLARCLESLHALDYPAFEVIVVDNAPATPDTETLVAAAAWPRYVREDRPGLDWARNCGIAASRHEIIAFTDDDVRVDPSWLRGIAHGFADPSTMLVTGFVAPAELDTEAQVMFELGYGGMGKGLWPIEWRPDALHDGVAAHHVGVGANMAFRRSLFDHIGMFDTALDVGTPARGGGDLDMFHRVLAARMPARYEPRALTWHSHRPDMPALRRQLRDNGCAFAVYLMTCFARGTVRRATVVQHTIVWMKWLAGRFVRRLALREVVSLPLQLEEIRGAVSGPLAYLATRRRDAAIRGTAGTSVPLPSRRLPR